MIYDVTTVCQPIQDKNYSISERNLNGLRKGSQELISRAQMEANVNAWGEHSVCLGGSGINASKVIARLGGKVAVTGLIGDDETGSYLETECKSQGMTPAFNRMKDQPTAVCQVLTASDGERTMLTHLGAGSQEFLAQKNLLGARHVHMEGYMVGLSTTVNWVVEGLGIGTTFSSDLGSEGFVQFRKAEFQLLLNRRRLTILFGNHDEVVALTGQKFKQGLRDLAQYATVVGTRGAKGLIIQNGQERIDIPAVRASKVVSTVGAGDCAAGGFLWGYVTKKSLKECGEIAAKCGSIIVETWGTDLPPGFRKRVLGY